MLAPEHGFLPGQAPQAAHGLAAGSWSIVDGRRLSAFAPHNTTTTPMHAHFDASVRVHTPSSADLSPEDLLKLLDDLSSSGPGTAPPPATPVSPLVHSLSSATSGLSSSSLFASMPLFPSAEPLSASLSSGDSSLSSSAGTGPGLVSSSSATSTSSMRKEQVGPQLSTPSFASDSKPFDAGDILLPFDLDPAATAASLDLLAFPVFDLSAQVHASISTSSSSSVHPALSPQEYPSTWNASAIHPVTLDAMLESPLGLASTASTSPLSEFLASPMFSLAGDSSVPSATMSELPLPSPYEPTLSAPASASVDGPALAWFPPLPQSAPPSTLMSMSPLVCGLAHPPYTPSSTPTTVLRPLPPAPEPALSRANPDGTPSTTTPAPPASAAIATTSGTKKRPAPTGFRHGAPPLLPLDAPVQARHSVIPSATSKRRKTSAAEKALAKRKVGAAPRSVSGSGSSTPHPSEQASSAPGLVPANEDSSLSGPPPLREVEVDEHKGDDVVHDDHDDHEAQQGDDLPADIVAAVERKRLQNTLSARKSRARKQARMQELEGENAQLRQRVQELEVLLGLAATTTESGGTAGALVAAI